MSKSTLQIQRRPQFAGQRLSLVKGTLACRLCGRSAGELIGNAMRPPTEARFFPSRSGSLPVSRDGTLRCGRCGGKLYLDDVEELARSVELSEVGGLPLARTLALAHRSTALAETSDRLAS